MSAWPDATRRPAPRRSSYLNRDPDLIRLAVAATVIGVLAGAAGFILDSSRGLDEVELASIASTGAIVVVVALAVFGVGRLAMFQDLRPLAVAGALVLGSAVGDAAAFRLLPGTTTDGSMRIIVLHAATPPPPSDATTRVTCRWDPATHRVIEVVSRRPFGLADAPYPARLFFTTASGSLTIARHDPATASAVLEYAGTATVTLDQPSGSRGSATFEAIEVDILDAGVRGSPFVSQLGPVSGTMTWGCPELP